MVIKVYHTENGISNASYFMEEMFNKQKKMRFSGAGTSYQNGSADRTIKTVVTVARNILIHTDIRFIEGTYPTDIWPVKMDYAVWIYNHIPDMQYGLSFIYILPRSRLETVS